MGLILLFTAAAAADLSEQINACRKLPSPSERLDCYDGVVDSSKKPEQSGAATADRSNDPAPPPRGSGEQVPESGLSQEELFGRNAEDVKRRVEKATGAERLVRLEARIASVRTIAPGKVAVKLDNGQTWRQITVSRLRLKKDDVVIIERGSLGSYRLTRTGSSVMMRVSRAE